MSEEHQEGVAEAATEGAAAGEAAVATTVAFAFSTEREAKFQEIVRRYPTSYSAIMPTLWLCQDEWGWLKPGVPEWVAERLDVPVSRVYESEARWPSPRSGLGSFFDAVRLESNAQTVSRPTRRVIIAGGWA